MQSQPGTEVVKRRPAYSPARTEVVAERVGAFRKHGRAAPFEAASPEVGTDEVLEFEGWPLFQKNYFLACFAELGGEENSGGACADDDGVDLVVGHAYHFLLGRMCGM